MFDAWLHQGFWHLSLIQVVLVGLALSQVDVMATTIYMHRYLAHGSVEWMSKYLDWSFRFVLWTTTGVVARDWAAVHRKHHQHSDRPGDPYSPVVDGFWTVFLETAVLYKRQLKQYRHELETQHAAVRHSTPDEWDRRCFDRPWGLALGIVVAFILLGPVGGTVISVVHTISYLLVGGTVNAVTHWFGSMKYTNKGAEHTGNLWWLAILIGGEPYHNNHHGDPMNPRFGAIDPGYGLMVILERLHLLGIRRKPRREPEVSMNAKQAAFYRRQVRSKLRQLKEDAVLAA